MQSGLSDANEWQALLKKQMMNITSEVTLLVDSSKFGVKTFAHIANLDQIQYVITDERIPEEYENWFQEKNISFQVVPS